MKFPELVLALAIVSAGIFALSQFSDEASWLLTILLLIILAFRYQKFADELSKLLAYSAPVVGQDSKLDTTLPNIDVSGTS